MTYIETVSFSLRLFLMTSNVGYVRIYMTSLKSSSIVELQIYERTETVSVHVSK